MDVGESKCARYHQPNGDADMTENQAGEIILLLEKILNKLEDIDQSIGQVDQSVGQVSLDIISNAP